MVNKTAIAVSPILQPAIYDPEADKKRAVMQLGYALLDDPFMDHPSTAAHLDKMLLECEKIEAGCVARGLDIPEEGFAPVVVGAAIAKVGSILAKLGVSALVGKLILSSTAKLSAPIGKGLLALAKSKALLATVPRAAPVLTKVGTGAAKYAAGASYVGKVIGTHAPKAWIAGVVMEAVGTGLTTARAAGMPTPVAEIATAYAVGSCIEEVAPHGIKPVAWTKNQIKLFLDGKRVRGPWGLWAILIAAGVSIAMTLFGTTRHSSGGSRTVDLSDEHGRHVATVRSVVDADGTEYWERL